MPKRSVRACGKPGVVDFASRGRVEMRVITGSAKGTRLEVPRGLTVRPTGSRARETLFNVLGATVADRIVLDLFAGSGALGIEALSRGARFCTFVDRDRRAASAVRNNLARCHLEDRARVLACEWRQALTRLAAEEVVFDLLFIDPPYESGAGISALERAAESPVLAPTAIAVFEHRSGSPAVPAGWVERRRLAVGDTGFLLLSRVSVAAAPC